MALTLTLLVGAGLIIVTTPNVADANPGSDTQHVITFKVGFSPSVTTTASAMRTAYRQLLNTSEHFQGMQAVDYPRTTFLSSPGKRRRLSR